MSGEQVHKDFRASELLSFRASGLMELRARNHCAPEPLGSSKTLHRHAPEPLGRSKTLHLRAPELQYLGSRPLRASELPSFASLWGFAASKTLLFTAPEPLSARNGCSGAAGRSKRPHRSHWRLENAQICWNSARENLEKL